MESVSESLTGKRVLVTGGTGFVGKTLVRRLASIVEELRVLALPDDPVLEEIGSIEPPVCIFKGNVREPDSLIDAFNGVEIVFHCAGIVTDWAPLKLFRNVNIEGTRNVVNAAAETGVKRFVHISTNDVFGLKEDKMIDETYPLSRWKEPYPDTKIAGENICWKAHTEGRLDVTMVYPCWVYGPGDETFIPEIARALREKEMVLWRPDCLVWPNHVENLVDLLLLVATKKEASGQGYLAHDDISITLRDFCNRIADGIGAQPPKLVLPKWLAALIAMLMQGIWRLLHIRHRPLLTTYIVKNLGARLHFTIDKAKNELGFKPRIQFEEGLTETLSDF